MNTCRKLEVLNRKARGRAYFRRGFCGFRADWIYCAAIVVAISVEGAMGVSIRPVLEDEQVAEWVFDGSGEWRLGGGELRLEVAGVPEGPIRRPAALALLKDSDFERFELEAEVRSTADPGLEVADVLLIFAYRSPTQFYYVHLSGKTDAVHNGIFVVDNVDRRRIDDGTGRPMLADREWHAVRLTHDPETGRIEVFMDRSESPGLKAVDRTLGGGKVGFGSFDDTGRIRNIMVSGPPEGRVDPDE